MGAEPLTGRLLDAKVDGIGNKLPVEQDLRRERLGQTGGSGNEAASALDRPDNPRQVFKIPDLGFGWCGREPICDLLHPAERQQGEAQPHAPEQKHRLRQEPSPGAKQHASLTQHEHR